MIRSFKRSRCRHTGASASFSVTLQLLQLLISNKFTAARVPSSCCGFLSCRYVVLFFYPLDFTFVCPTGASPARGSSVYHSCWQPARCGSLTVACLLWIVDCRLLVFQHATLVTAEITAFSDKHGEFAKINTEVQLPVLARAQILISTSCAEPPSATCFPCLRRSSASPWTPSSRISPGSRQVIAPPCQECTCMSSLISESDIQHSDPVSEIGTTAPSDPMCRQQRVTCATVAASCTFHAACCASDPHCSAADRKEGGVGDLNYPLVSDLKREISVKYGVLSEEGVALRGLFIIDKEVRRS